MAFLWKATDGERVQYGVEAVYSLKTVESWYRYQAKKRARTNFMKALTPDFKFSIVAEGSKEEMTALKSYKISSSKKPVLNRRIVKKVSREDVLAYVSLLR